MLLTISRIASLVCALALLISCGGGGDLPETDGKLDQQHALSAASDPAMDVQLPFVDGGAFECSQNSNDTPTHNYPSTRYDLDFGMPVGTIVVAAADGVARVYPDESNNGGFGWYVRVDHDDGRWTMYAHLSGFIVANTTTGQRVVAGQPIAYSGGKKGASGAGTSTGPHLHFGVHRESGVGESVPMRVYARDQSEGTIDYFSTGSTSDFRCAVYSSDGKTKLVSGHFYESRPVGSTFSDYQCRRLSDGTILCWQGNPVDCLDGSDHVWYRKDSEGAYMSSSVDKHQKCSLNTGQVTNVVAYLEGGYGVGGYGPGGPTEAADPPTPGLPDFIGESAKFDDGRYSFSQSETHRVHAILGNTGDANWAGDHEAIDVRIYLSKGSWKDDSGERIRLGIQQIQRGNLDVGDHKDEYFTINLLTANHGSPLPPGVYNYIVCADRNQDEDNGDGEVSEKHKSNNCTSELVFEVTLDPSVPRPNFTVHGLVPLQTPYYAADPARFGGYIRNAGAARPFNGIRSQWSIECPGTGRIVLTDDSTDADQLDPGESAYESNQSLVYMPNVAGQCTVYLCADQPDEVLESDEGDNCQAISITLQPRPAAKLVITSFADVNNCCTTNRGSRLYPRVFVRNDGNAAPASPYPPVIYHIASPIATGGQYTHMGNGSLRQTGLAPGATDNDTMDGNGWVIPAASTWKNQWHSIRACIRADGGQPVGNESTEVCRVYQHYSKK